MTLTNNYNLPEVFINACRGFERQYKDGLGTISQLTVTELNKPPLMRRLEKEHAADLSSDITERIWVLTGSAIHKILEEGRAEECLTEERLFIKIDGITISGQTDVYHENGILQDYKFTSVYKYIFRNFEDWEKQLNVYGYLFENIGFPVNSLQVIAILKDWSKRKAKFESDYPKCPVATIDLQKWPESKTLNYIKSRIVLHVKAEQTPIDRIPVCTTEERWARPTTYAVLKHGLKKAVRVLPSKEAAEVYLSRITKDRDKCYVERRPGADVRCEDFCMVSDWCPFFTGGSDTKNIN